jgi:isoleucyl-tRNA synthetase
VISGRTERGHKKSSFYSNTVDILDLVDVVGADTLTIWFEERSFLAYYRSTFEGEVTSTRIE